MVYCFCELQCNFFVAREPNLLAILRKRLIDHCIGSFSPLRVEQKKLQDRLAALEKITREHAALRTTTKSEGDSTTGQ